MKVKSYIYLFAIVIGLGACKKNPPRRPINKVKADGTFQSVELNKFLLELQEKYITEYMRRDSLKNYKTSQLGYQYTILKSANDSVLPIQKGDTLFYTQQVYSLNDREYYPKDSSFIHTHIVDKQPNIRGLEDGLKLMQKNEEFKFIFPSFVAYGLEGDKKRIKPNEPIVVKVKLLNIKN